jgi:hypothetical protein
MSKIPPNGCNIQEATNCFVEGLGSTVNPDLAVVVLVVVVDPKLLTDAEFPAELPTLALV